MRSKLKPTKTAIAMDGFESGKGSDSYSQTTPKAHYFLRILVLVLTLTSAVVLGIDNQTKTVLVKVLDNVPALSVPVTAKWHYSSAFVYSVVANAIACSYAALSLLLLLTGKKSLVPVVTLFDLLVIGLLFSCNGASGAFGILGYNGNSHVRWNKVCDTFDRFCGQVAASVALSLLAGVILVAIVFHTAIRAQRRSK